MKNTLHRSLLTACCLLAPLGAGCIAPDEEGGSSLDESAPEEVAAEPSATPAPPTQSLVGEACKNTDITITNSRTRNGVNTAIELRSVQFYNLTEGKWTSEDLVNAVMNFNDTLVWFNEDLADAEGDVISKWRVYYRFATGGSWSSEVYQEIDTPNETCVYDSEFELTVE